jgi:uncharacterized protein (UPF0333 family)
MKKVGGSLTSEEKLMASFIKYEQFFKKYKFHLLAIVLIIVGAIAYNAVDSALKQSSLKKANEAFLTLKSDPDNAQALEDLKNNNEKLYTLYVIHRKLNEKDTDLRQNYTATAEVTDIAAYHEAIIKEDLGNYDGLYNELAHLIEGYHLLKNGKNEEAVNVLGKIPADSQLSANVKILMHYANGVNR